MRYRTGNNTSDHHETGNFLKLSGLRLLVGEDSSGKVQEMIKYRGTLVLRINTQSVNVCLWIWLP
jgi:hypothetical protein